MYNPSVDLFSGSPVDELASNSIPSVTEKFRRRRHHIWLNWRHGPRNQHPSACRISSSNNLGYWLPELIRGRYIGCWLSPPKHQPAIESINSSTFPHCCNTSNHRRNPGANFFNWICLKKKFNLKFKFNSKLQEVYCSNILIPPRNIFTSAGIELESPRLPVGSADHSATQTLIFPKIYFFFDCLLHGRRPCI